MKTSHSGIHLKNFTILRINFSLHWNAIDGRNFFPGELLEVIFQRYVLNIFDVHFKFLQEKSIFNRFHSNKNCWDSSSISLVWDFKFSLLQIDFFKCNNKILNSNEMIKTFSALFVFFTYAKHEVLSDMSFAFIFSVSIAWKLMLHAKNYLFSVAQSVKIKRHKMYDNMEEVGGRRGLLKWVMFLSLLSLFFR